MTPRRSILRAFAFLSLIVVCVTSCNLPSNQKATSTSFDQATLMMIASRGLLDLYVPAEVAAPQGNASSIKLESLVEAPQLLTTLEELNQHKALAAYYQRLVDAAKKDGNLVLVDIFTQKVQVQQAAADQLEAKRAEWRRNRRFLTVIKRGARDFGHFVGQVIDFVGQGIADNINARIESYVAEIKAFLANPLRYTFDLTLKRQLEIIKNQFIDRLGPFFGQRAYDLIRLDQKAWKVEGHLFNGPTKPTATKKNNPGDVLGGWHGDACEEAEGTYIYRWSVDLMQDPATGRLAGTVKFHDCPGGGRVLFRVTGDAPKGSVFTLTGILKDGGGDLFQSMEQQLLTPDGKNNTVTFTLDSSTQQITPNYAP
jgi:hypothetical protein